MPDLRNLPRLDTGASRTLENTGCARSLRSLRLPSVARLEFTPYLIQGGNDVIQYQVNFFRTSGVFWNYFLIKL